MSVKIIPTVFSENWDDFSEKMLKVKKVSRNIHIDIMDGRFVRRKSPELKKMKLDSKHYYEAHLMVRNPINYISKVKKMGFKKIIFHVEACKKGDILKAVDISRKSGLEVFIAINPGTNLKRAIDFFNSVNGVLIMGVKPGKEGQELDRNIYSRIRRIRKSDNKIVIQIDGGVRPANAGSLAKAGAGIINTGSYVAKSDNPGKALNALRIIANEKRRRV